MECRELAPVLSRVGSALQYRRDWLTFTPAQLYEFRISSKRFGMPNIACLQSCKGQNWESGWPIMIRVILQCHSQPTGGVFVASKPFSCIRWSKWLWRTMFLAVSSNHCSWNDWLSMEMFHNFFFIVRTGLKLAGLKPAARKTNYIQLANRLKVVRKLAKKNNMEFKSNFWWCQWFSLKPIIHWSVDQFKGG